MDGVLLRFSSCFFILYSIFCIITGSFVSPIRFENSHGQLLILNGVVEIMQILLQLIFLNNLKEKVRKMVLSSKSLDIYYWCNVMIDLILHFRPYRINNKCKILDVNLQFSLFSSICLSGWCWHSKFKNSVPVWSNPISTD